MNARGLAASALSGAASGCRSFTGIAALLSEAGTGDRHAGGEGLTKLAGRPWFKVLVRGLALQEFVVDKLPIAPSRLGPLGLATRFAGAIGCGAVIMVLADPDAGARSDEPSRGRRIVQFAGYAAVAAAASFGSAALGRRWRAWAGRRLGHDLIAAAIEDAAAMSLAGAATRLLTQAADPQPGRAS